MALEGPVGSIHRYRLNDSDFRGPETELPGRVIIWVPHRRTVTVVKFYAAKPILIFALRFAQYYILLNGNPK